MKKCEKRNKVIEKTKTANNGVINASPKNAQYDNFNRRHVYHGIKKKLNMIIGIVFPTATPTVPCWSIR